MLRNSQKGKEFSEAQKSMFFKGKRKGSLWFVLQVCKVLNIAVYVDADGIFFADREWADKYVRISSMTGEELASLHIDREEIGPLLFQYARWVNKE